MEKRILAVLIATIAGTAGAQSYVTSGAGAGVVTNGYGQCWQNAANATPGAGCPGGAAVGSAPVVATTAASAAAGQTRAARTPTAERTQLAQADTRDRRTATTANRAVTSTQTNSPNPAPGYVGAGNGGVVVTNPYGLCWRSGADWSADKAAAPCDAVPTATVAQPPVVAASPQPEPAPAPVAQPAPAPAPIAAAPVAPPPPVIEKITLGTDVLFEFGKAELRQTGQQRLDDLAKNAQGAEVDKVVVVGHADRIASEQFNKDLSERRAQAVADYLAQKGVDKSRLQIEGRGEAEPVTGDDCKKLGAEKASNKKLVSCLQPDRRVEIELLGQREQAAGATTSPSGAGATGTSGSSTSGQGGASR